MRLSKYVAEQDRAAENNICGILVATRPERAESVGAALAELPGVEVHHATEDGRLIVTVEDTEAGWAGQTITRFYEIEGVISAALVYHHSEAGDLEESFS